MGVKDEMLRIASVIAIVAGGSLGVMDEWRSSATAWALATVLVLWRERGLD